MKIEAYTILYLSGALLAAVFMMVLLGKSRIQQLGNRLLLALMASIFLVLVQYSLTMNGLSGKVPWVWPLGTAAWYTISPLMLLFTSSVLSKDFRLRPLHLLLFIVPFYHLVQYFLESFGIFIGFHLLFDSFPSYSYAWLLTYHLYALIFSAVCLRIIWKSRSQNPLSQRSAWLWNYFLAMSGMIVVSLVLLCMAVNSQVYISDYEWIWVVMFELFVFAIFLISLRSSAMLQTDDSNDSVYLPTPETGPKYANTTMNKAEMEGLLQKLRQTMHTQRPYLDGKLSLAELSQLSQISQNDLSQLFSTHLESNFYDFVNAYRLQELEKRLLDPAYSHFKIASLAEDCGFNSKASFYRYFKSTHQMTPTEYLKQMKAREN